MSFKRFVATLALTLGTSSAVQAAKNFNRISFFPTYLNVATGEDTKQESSAEIRLQLMGIFLSTRIAHLG